MLIHNFFSDLLLSVRILLDDVVFKSSPINIKHYEFNIANRTFTMSDDDYGTNFELPSAIITLEDDSYSFGERPGVIQNITAANYNQQVAVFDTETNHQIILQEEQCQTRMMININCETPLHAKDIEFHIKRYLPVSKYICLFPFTSFMEISPDVLSKHGIQWDKDSSINLFTRLHGNTGQVEYCYSMQYQPLIRLESISTSIGDGSQRSFTVSINIMYQIQIPMWIFSTKLPGIIERINVDFVRFGNDPISKNSIRQAFNSRIDDKYGDIKRVAIMNLVVSEFASNLSSNMINDDNIVCVIQLNPKILMISPDFEFDILGIDNQWHMRINPTMIDKEDNKVIFRFHKDEYNAKYNASLVNPIIVRFIENRENFVDNRT